MASRCIKLGDGYTAHSGYRRDPTPIKRYNKVYYQWICHCGEDIQTVDSATTINHFTKTKRDR